VPVVSQVSLEPVDLGEDVRRQRVDAPELDRAGSCPPKLHFLKYCRSGDGR